ncbi:MAG: CDP-alcohol phosphatidyltransferase family protein [Candidatus Woykebacteria bacterium]
MDKIKPFSISNLVSYLALLLAWISILLLINGRFHLSLGTALVAFIADTFDGFLARRFKQESEFGRQLDSFVDAFIYLIYPSLVFYLHFKLQDLTSVVILYIFVLAGVFRLVRFNIVGYVGEKTKMGYPGLPVVFSYLTIFSVSVISLAISGLSLRLASWLLIILQSSLMIGTFAFPKPQRIWPIVTFLLLIALYMFYLGLK